MQLLRTLKVIWESVLQGEVFKYSLLAQAKPDLDYKRCKIVIVEVSSESLQIRLENLIVNMSTTWELNTRELNIEITKQMSQGHMKHI